MLSSSQLGRRRSKKICPVRPSQMIRPPSITKIISIERRRVLSGVSGMKEVESRKLKVQRKSSTNLGQAVAPAIHRKHNNRADYPTRSIFTWLMVTGGVGRSLRSLATTEILLATSWPSTTSPKMVCLLSSQVVGATVIKNWLPLVLGPELAMESLPALECLSDGWNSSANL